LEDQFGNYNGTAGQASAMSVALVGAFSQKLSRLISSQDPFLGKMLVGASLRIVSESIDEVSVFGGGIDVGAIWRETEEISPTQIAAASGVNNPEEGKALVRDRGWRFGVVAQNLGMTSDQLMPINFRAGAGYVAQELFSASGRGTLAVDALVPIDNDVKISVGTEYANISPNTEFAVRVGYKIGNEIKDLDSTAGLTAGLGFAIVAGLIKYQVDYAFVPYGDLGTTHRAALTLSFLPSENVVRTQTDFKAVVSAPKPEVMPAELAAKAKKKEESKAAEAKPAAAKISNANPAAGSAAVPLPIAAAAPVAAAGDEKNQNLKKLNGELRLFLKQISANMQSPLVFDQETANIENQAKKSLDKLGKILEKYPEGNVVIIGYAGKQTDLALARAKAVVRYMKMNFSLDPTRLTTKAGDPAQQPKNSAISLEVLDLKE
jgi:outer membrane protein OmpA-like peptidoglycan-associated protein